MTNDLISRSDLKDTMDFIEQTSNTYEEMVDRYKKAVDNAPTVTPEKALMDKLRGKEE